MSFWCPRWGNSRYIPGIRCFCSFCVCLFRGHSDPGIMRSGEKGSKRGSILGYPFWRPFLDHPFGDPSRMGGLSTLFYSRIHLDPLQKWSFWVPLYSVSLSRARAKVYTRASLYTQGDRPPRDTLHAGFCLDGPIPMGILPGWTHSYGDSAWIGGLLYGFCLDWGSPIWILPKSGVSYMDPAWIWV